MEKTVTKPVAAVTMASATRPVGSVCAHQAGPDPTAQKVSLHNREKWSSIRRGKDEVTLFFVCLCVCVFFSQNALQDFTAQTVASAACARMEPPVTRPTENVHVPADGREQPVNWVRVRDVTAEPP